MERLFVNVKTALFIVEHISDIYIVYDCGCASKRSTDYIDNAIDKVFPTGCTIEAVFISHYDSDHINGIHHLLNHCKIKRLILPMIPNAVLLYLLSNQSYNKEEEEFILAPEKYIQRKDLHTEILYVRNDNEENELNSAPISFDGLTNRFSSRELPSGIKITVNDFHWAFIPYNIRILSKTEETEFMDLLAKSISVPLDELKKTNIEDVWGKHDLDIKSAVNKCVGGLNNKAFNGTSMTLYSGPWIKERVRGNIGSLYLGDYDAKAHYDKLEIAYKEVMDLVGIVQIPHHGSLSYFDDRLIKLNRLAVISVSMPNGKIKPKETIDKILELNGMPLVTGYRGDILIYTMRIYNEDCTEFIDILKIGHVTVS